MQRGVRCSFKTTNTGDRNRESSYPVASGVPFRSIRVIDRSGGGRFNGEAKVAQTRENRIPASEHAV